MKRTAQGVYPSGDGYGPGRVYFLWRIGDGFAGPSGTPYDDGGTMNAPYWQYDNSTWSRRGAESGVRVDYEDEDSP